MFNCDPAGIARFFLKSTEGKCKELLASWTLMKKEKANHSVCLFQDEQHLMLALSSILLF